MTLLPEIQVGKTRIPFVFLPGRRGGKRACLSHRFPRQDQPPVIPGRGHFPISSASAKKSSWEMVPS